MIRTDFQNWVTGGSAWFLRLSIMFMMFSGLRVGAHSLRCFAAADGDKISGYAWFASGARPRHVPFRVYGPDGKLLSEGKTNNQGEFSFVPTQVCDQRVMVEAGPGHVGQFLIKTDELPAGLADAGTAKNSLPETPQTPVAEVNQKTINQTPLGNLSAKEFDILLAQAVSREIAPLRRDLNAFKEKRRWQDIIAGVGYLIGVAGIAGFCLSKKAPGS